MPAPDLDTFRRLAGSARYVPVYRQLVADALTPVSAFVKIRQGNQSFLFESVVGGEKIGRYSFLGSGPLFRIDARGTDVKITRGTDVETLSIEDPLDKLQELLDQFHAVHLPELPRFCGGAVGYAGYDVVRYTEHLPSPPTDDRNLPDLSFAFYDRMIIFDHINKTVLVVVHADTAAGSLDETYADAVARLDQLCRHLDSADAMLPVTDIAPTGEPSLAWTSDQTQESFEAAVEVCKEYIRAGDIFQVVLSQRLEVETTAQPLDIYRALRIVNPSPFMFLLDTPDVTLVGSSPEIMTRVEEGTVTVRPLAGTRRRGRTAAEDNALVNDLLADPKERAEHVMLVDLARNDVGRVARYGTIELSDVMEVERYSHVMHITSNVTGQLREGLTALDALRASLPAGTVSGAPKVRAMEIIDEQEKHRRGPYAGAVGYLDFTGNMDTCIALRTIVIQQGRVYVQAGAGLVADSVPASEYQETLNKAMGLLRAIEVAQTQLARR